MTGQNLTYAAAGLIVGANLGLILGAILGADRRARMAAELARNETIRRHQYHAILRHQATIADLESQRDFGDRFDVDLGHDDDVTDLDDDAVNDLIDRLRPDTP